MIVTFSLYTSKKESIFLAKDKCLIRILPLLNCIIDHYRLTVILYYLNKAQFQTRTLSNLINLQLKIQERVFETLVRGPLVVFFSRFNNWWSATTAQMVRGDMTRYQSTIKQFHGFFLRYDDTSLQSFSVFLFYYELKVS